MPNETPPKKRRPLITHNHKKRSLMTWITPLIAIIAIMVLLPRLIALLEK